MNRYLSILNYRTIVALAISIATIQIAYEFDIHYSLDLTLLSIAIIFPLVFSIRGSFRRREKALEHLSQFRSTLKTVRYFVMSNGEMDDVSKKEIDSILVSISRKVLSHLKDNDNETKDLDSVTDQLYAFIMDNDESISRSLKDKIFKCMKDLHESIENLHAIHIHRTPISLKAYCIVFIFLFPLFYTPTIIHDIGTETNHWVTYFVVLSSEFILISLYNIQNHLEYPFDDVGLDDIKLDTFRINR